MVAKPNLLSRLIFMSRWLQAPLYFGLIVAQGVYVYHFAVELWHLVSAGATMKETDIMLIVLGLIDVVMIANLLGMIIIGGYENFVASLGISDEARPDWLDHVNANTLKVKLAMALVGISSIHLLKSFINAASLSDRELIAHSAIHCIFLFSALALAWTDKVMRTDHKPSKDAGKINEKE
jgi:uncharacterized protein (TIGR00645 family)